ncbi:hypothetical protein CDL12_02129 [Handroanthus impetiginosus]|uniref:Uncharacterized protein n=1 Tax=Handroanthus impetiginosus TaxID=429701 RepID=A0A2G9I5W9_9LAMI|nr:hypothetical protein CDL12_02129 [Handroanthus impetiginosus]
MQIIERGSWDEVFSINDGGHAHMKLQVILNEEERNRIRIVRESAMKKKLETNPNINLKPSETVSSEEKSTKNEHKVPDSYKGFVEIDVMSPKAEASQAGLPSNSATSSAVTPSTHQKKEESILESTIPNTTDGSEGATPSSPQVHEQVDIRSNVEKGSSSKLSGLVISELKNDPIQKSQNQGPLEKTPSNVRKMISAFENNQLQEVKTLMKRSPSAPSNLNRFRKEPSEDREQKEEKNYGKFNHFAEAPKELDSRAKIVKEMENSPVDIMRQSTSETATSSGRMLDEQSPVGGAYKLSSKLISSSESPVAEGSGGGRGIGLKGLTVVDVQVVSNPKRKSLENYKEECYSTQSCGMWIFPDNTRRLCITTAGKQVMNIVGNQRKEAKACQAKKISSEAQVLEKNPMHGTKHKMEKNRNRVAKQPESAHGSSPDDSSRGVIGQVIKIAVILGFGALVLLTRQKEPRKKQKEQNDDLFPVPDYIDKRTMKPWPLQQ